MLAHYHALLLSKATYGVAGAKRCGEKVLGSNALCCPMSRSGNGSDSSLLISVFIFFKRMRMRIRILSNMNAEHMLFEYEYESDVLKIWNRYE
jgi:hypothetical protein